MNERIKCMFDANIFSRIVVKEISVESLPKCCDVYVTHIQEDELHRTPKSDIKAKLLEVFRLVEEKGRLVGAGLVPTESFVFDVSKLAWRNGRRAMDYMGGFCLL